MNFGECKHLTRFKVARGFKNALQHVIDYEANYFACGGTQ